MQKANQKGVDSIGRTTHLDQRITEIVAGCGMVWGGSGTAPKCGYRFLRLSTLEQFVA
jgi:hypothetical protein